jgi:simple sugar transport system permease protein
MGVFGTVAIAMIAGALRVSTPFLFVSLGECLTEKSGRINLGNEGALVLGAMVAYATSYHTNNPWAGVAAAAAMGLIFGAAHGAVCALPRVNDVAMGIAFMLAGTGTAFFFGKPYVQPTAPALPPLPLGFWSDLPQVRSALEVSPLFFIGLGCAWACACASSATAATRRWRSVCRSTASACSPPPSAAAWRASAARSSR